MAFELCPRESCRKAWPDSGHKCKDAGPCTKSHISNKALCLSDGASTGVCEVEMSLSSSHRTQPEWEISLNNVLHYNFGSLHALITEAILTLDDFQPFTVSGHTLKSWIRLKVNFVQVEKQWSCFIFLHVEIQDCRYHL